MNCKTCGYDVEKLGGLPTDDACPPHKEYGVDNRRGAAQAPRLCALCPHPWHLPGTTCGVVMLPSQGGPYCKCAGE